MSNNRQISKLIESVTGLKGVKVFAKDGCCRFYSDNEVTSEILASVETQTVWVCHISHLTAEQWLQEFQSNFYQKDRSLVRETLAA
jgi:hypothetical protein